MNVRVALLTVIIVLSGCGSPATALPVRSQSEATATVETLADQALTDGGSGAAVNKVGVAAGTCDDDGIDVRGTYVFHAPDGDADRMIAAMVTAWKTRGWAVSVTPGHADATVPPDNFVVDITSNGNGTAGVTVRSPCFRRAT